MAKRSRHTIDGAIKNFVGDYQWEHRNAFFIILSIIVAYILLKSQLIHNSIATIGDLGYIGSFVAGLFYAYTLTAIPATASLFLLGGQLNPILIAITGAAGAVLGDYMIFRFVKDSFIQGLEEFPTLRKIIFKISDNMKKSKISKKLIPLLAGFIIASPLPDELGVSMLGMVRFRSRKFFIYSFSLNFIGILLIAFAGKVL